MTQNADSWIKDLGLLPHPEGGFYRETYRSEEILPRAALPDRFTGERCCATSIYFLLRGGEVSTLHRIQSDEIWYYHAGAPLNIYVISPDGALAILKLGLRIESGELPQAIVPAGSWFGVSPAADGDYSLVGCSVSPGFDFVDFELASRTELLKEYPEHREVIMRFTR